MLKERDEAHRDTVDDSGDDDYGAEEAAAKSLAERMQETYPFATSSSPMRREEPSQSHRIDMIMNAEIDRESVAASSSSSMDFGDDYYGNENDDTQNAISATDREELLLPGKSSIAFILGSDNTQGEADAEDQSHDDEEGDDWGEVSSDASLGNAFPLCVDEVGRSLCLRTLLPLIHFMRAQIDAILTSLRARAPVAEALLLVLLARMPMRNAARPCDVRLHLPRRVAARSRSRASANLKIARGMS